jgi:hypothetical protein
MRRPPPWLEVRAAVVAVITAREQCRCLIRTLTESQIPGVSSAAILDSEFERSEQLGRALVWLEGLEREAYAAYRKKPANNQLTRRPKRRRRRSA